MKTVIVFFSMLFAPSVDRGHVSVTMSNLRLLQNAVSEFKMDTGRLPRAHEGLSALVTRPADSSSWPAGGYLETSEVPKDAWGRDFVYVLDPNLPQGFGIYSRGQDGVTSSHGNDTDDINTWDDQMPWKGHYKTQTMRRAGIENIASIAIVLLILAAVVLILTKGFGRERRNRNST